MLRYKTIYKCRLCEEIFESGETDTEDLARKAVVSLAMGDSGPINGPSMLNIHFCRDGSFGIADFHGMKGWR